MSVAVPRPASTVVIVRPHAEAFQVLLVRRNDQVAFMAGAHVFPGGRVDPQDAVGLASPYCEGTDVLPEFPDLSAEDELAYRVAALRELVEEAGLLMARGADGATASAEVAAAIRARMAAGEPLPALVLEYGLRLSVDAILPFAHWVTPDIEPRRYDTRFFLARVPAGQTARHDGGELTEFRWIPPAEAVALCQQGELLLPPPTWTTLKQLARQASVDDLFRWARARTIIRVQPHLVREADQTVLTLPGDPSVPPPAGWEIPEDTRFVLRQGQGWKPVRA